MVSFICNACGQTVRKNRVEKHYLSECPSCSILSCIDCGTDFHGDEYSAHNSCISEAEKYQGKLYRPKENVNKGDLKQQEWMKQVQKASDKVMDPKLKQYLMKITEYSNVPRKKSKFLNFCKNSLRVYNDDVLENIWEAFEKTKETKIDKNAADIGKGTESSENGLSNGAVNGNGDWQSTGKDATMNVKRKRKGEKEPEMTEKKKKRKKEKEKLEAEINGENIMEDENGPMEEQSKIGKFNWQKTIKAVIKDAGEEGVPMKKLRKKVLAAYDEHGYKHQTFSKEECSAIFKKKLSGYPKAKVLKERVFYKK